jgi:hypothetical protein
VHSSREGIESCCSVRLLRGKNVKTSVSVRGRGPTAHGSGVTLVCREHRIKTDSSSSTLFLCIITYVGVYREPVRDGTPQHEVKRTGECGGSKEP